MITEEEEWDLQAAEYVLGTLHEETHRVFDALSKVDEDWQRRVQRWRVCLDPLNVLTKPIEPPTHVLVSVMERVNELPSSEPVKTTKALTSSALATSALSAQASSDDMVHSGAEGAALAKPLALSSALTTVSSSHSLPERTRTISAHARDAADSDELSVPAHVTIRVLNERARYWKLAAMVSTLAFIGTLFLAPRYLEQRQSTLNTARTVAVLQDDTNAPLWTVSYHVNGNSMQPADNSSQGTISVTAVGDPQASAPSDHQLWIVFPEDAGVRSVGRMPDAQGETVTLDLPIALAEAGEFAVTQASLERVPRPDDGSFVARARIINLIN